MAQPLDREALGRVVREVWVENARTLDNPKPSNLLPWEELDEWNQEVDRCIGERVAMVVTQESQALLRELLDFTAYEPPTLRRNLAEWRAERDALRARAREILERKQS